MADATRTTKVYMTDGGDRLVVASGGSIDVETGGKVTINGTQGAALTAQLTTITHAAPGTPDYAIQDLTDSGGFGFASKDEGNSVLAVIANLQTRMAELEARCQAAGIVAAA